MNRQKSTSLLTPREVAETLRISRSYAYQLLNTGKIPCVRIGKSCRVHPDDLRDYIDFNREQPIGA